MIVTIFKDLFKSKDAPYYVSLEKVIERIKIGKSVEKIECLRLETDKEKASKIKNMLPCILFAGQFSERNGNSLQEHSGLCVLDFDNIPSNEIDSFKSKISNNPHVITCFKSPSGNGLKAVIKIPKCDKETHKQYFKGFEMKYLYEYFDSKNCNIDRVCFESYDPDIYFNPNAIVFDELIEDEGFQVTDKVPFMPIKSDGEIIKKLMIWWNKKYGFENGSRNNNIYLLALAFSNYGISIQTTITYIFENVIQGEFSNVEAETAIKSAFKKGETDFGTKYFEDRFKYNVIKNEIYGSNKKEIIEKFGIDSVTYEKISKEKGENCFWKIDSKAKVFIDSKKFKAFLELNGYRKYFPFDVSKPNLIKVISNKVSDTNISEIKDFVLNYLAEKNEDLVWNFFAESKLLFTEPYLSMLDTIELTLLKDTKETSFIAYKNGILQITNNKINLIDYLDIDCYIWENQIINRDFKKSDNFENDFQQFVYNVSTKEPRAMESVIGYLLSTFKGRLENKAIILNDESISQNPEGGTGKGLFMQAISQIRKVAILDGKSFDDKKSFQFQTVGLDTQIIFFDDVVKNFNFENKFSLVTEGITLERKNKDAIKLPLEDSPKMVIATNYAIKGEGNSHDRRRFELEFAHFYNKSKTPESDFGRELFKDWSKEEYTAFDNYMVYCLQTFLKDGLIKQNAKNIELRRFLAGCSSEFYEWIEDIENVPRNQELGKGEYLMKFQYEYKDYQKLSGKAFHGWIEKYCKFKKNKFEVTNSNGIRGFKINTYINE
jgi:hypothetical protein